MSDLVSSTIPVSIEAADGQICQGRAGATDAHGRGGAKSSVALKSPRSSSNFLSATGAATTRKRRDDKREIP